MKASQGNDRLMMLNLLSPIVISFAEKGNVPPGLVSVSDDGVVASQDVAAEGGWAPAAKCSSTDLLSAEDILAAVSAASVS